MDIKISDNILALTVDATIYSETVLFKCFYWYANAFEVEISKISPSSYAVHLRPKETPDWDTIIPKIKRNLVDFKLRQIVTDETATIRDLIVAKAFAHYEETDTPLTAIADPVGFDPQTV